MKLKENRVNCDRFDAICEDSLQLMEKIEKTIFQVYHNGSSYSVDCGRNGSKGKTKGFLTLGQINHKVKHLFDQFDHLCSWGWKTKSEHQMIEWFIEKGFLVETDQWFYGRKRNTRTFYTQVKNMSNMFDICDITPVGGFLDMKTTFAPEDKSIWSAHNKSEKFDESSIQIPF